MKSVIRRFISVFVAVITVFSVVAVAFAAEDDIVIEDGVLKKCTVSQKVYDVPQEVKEIAENAFVSCDGLEEIFVGNNVRLIGSGAFLGCPDLSIVCFTGTEEITIMENIVDKESVSVVVNNKNTALRKSIAMNGYNWYAFECFAASGKNILAFIYGISKDKATASELCLDLVDTFKPDYVYFEDSNSYYLAKDRTSTEVDYSALTNPGFFVKFNVNITMNKLPDKTDVNNGNDRAKNGWIKFINAIVKAFS